MNKRLSIFNFSAALGAVFLFSLLSCGQISSTAKQPGHSCILQGLACSALPRSVCSIGKGYYQPYTCKSVGYQFGPCSRDSYGAIFAKTSANCERIRVLRGAR